jgi:hypothetical protein
MYLALRQMRSVLDIPYISLYNIQTDEILTNKTEALKTVVTQCNIQVCCDIKKLCILL